MKIDNSDNKYEVGKLYYTSLLELANSLKRWSSTSGIISFTVNEKGDVNIEKLYTRKTPIGKSIVYYNLNYQILRKTYVHDSYEEAVECHNKRVEMFLPNNPEYFVKHLIGKKVSMEKQALLWYRKRTKQEKEYIKLLTESNIKK